MKLGFVLLFFYFSFNCLRIIRAVKMGYNPRANPAHHGFGSGWVEKKLKISVRVKNESNSLRTRLIRIEPQVSSPTRQ